MGVETENKFPLQSAKKLSEDYVVTWSPLVEKNNRGESGLVVLVISRKYLTIVF